MSDAVNLATRHAPQLIVAISLAATVFVNDIPAVFDVLAITTPEPPAPPAPQLGFGGALLPPPPPPPVLAVPAPPTVGLVPAPIPPPPGADGEFAPKQGDDEEPPPPPPATVIAVPVILFGTPEPPCPPGPGVEPG